MLKLKFQCFDHLMRRADSLKKTLMLGKTEGPEEKGATENEMVGWHHWLNGHEFEKTPGDGEGQGNLACCSPWGHKESDTTEWLNNNYYKCKFSVCASIFPSIRIFSSESILCIKWPKFWNISLSISPANEYSGLTSFKIDGLDLLAVQETLKSLLQHHSSKASVLQCSAFFIVQHSHPYITTGKNHSFD